MRGLICLGVGQAELDVAGRADDGRTFRVTVGGEPEHEALAGVREAGHRDDDIELIERLEGQATDAGTQRSVELCIGLARTCEDDACSWETRSQGSSQFAA